MVSHFRADFYDTFIFEEIMSAIEPNKCQAIYDLMSSTRINYIGGFEFKPCKEAFAHFDSLYRNGELDMMVKNLTICEQDRNNPSLYHCRKIDRYLSIEQTRNIFLYCISKK
jgi:hypothetical protein